MTTRDDLLTMDRRALMAELCHGFAINPYALDDTEYRGISLGLPELVDRLTWKKFAKTFHRDPATGALRGWNVRIEQGPLDEPWAASQRGGRARTFGHYQVLAAAGYRMQWSCKQGLMLDYGLGGNGRLDPMRRVRDPLVAVNEGSVELLLGWSYVDLGVTQVGTPSFFCLERGGALTHSVAPPR